jgi:hypothetical protein
MTRDELKARRDELLADIERRENENPFMQRRAPSGLVFKVREQQTRAGTNVPGEPTAPNDAVDDNTLMLEAVAEFVTEMMHNERAAHQKEIMALRERVARLEGVIAGLLENKERVFELPALSMRGRQ